MTQFSLHKDLLEQNPAKHASCGVNGSRINFDWCTNSKGEKMVGAGKSSGHMYLECLQVCILGSIEILNYTLVTF